MSVDARVDVFLQYYRPHVSGLTNMAAVIAEYAAARGYEVHVHCVAADRHRTDSVMDGVHVHAYGRSLQIRRAAFSLELVREMWRLRKRSGVAHAHLPYPESFLLAWFLGRRWSFVTTYQCDAPKGTVAENLVAAALDWSHRLLIRRSIAVVASSADYAAHSRLAKEWKHPRGMAVPATSIDRAGGKPRYAVPGKKLVGFIGRPTFEKGINVLLEALQGLPEDYALLFAGPVTGLTESVGYDVHLMERLIDEGRIIPLGFLAEEDIPDFYASVDVYVHPSINSFDAFGIVQVEAASAGVPLVPSDLPGVRTIAQETGLGEVSVTGDASSLRQCIVTASTTTYDVAKARRVLEDVYLAPRPHEAYMRLYERALAERSGRSQA